MQGCPLLKDTLVRGAAFTLRHFARLPVHDPTSGFRLFSRRVIEDLQVESDQGFTYSIELLVKAHRLGWRIGEGAGAVVRAKARHQPLPRAEMAAGLSAMVWLRLRHDLPATSAESVTRKPQTHGAG